MFVYKHRIRRKDAECAEKLIININETALRTLRLRSKSDFALSQRQN
jgi:hypothetical protein